MSKYKGKLIVLDGNDGAGKATQTRLLVSAMKKAEYKVETIDFPRHGESSCKLVDLYLEGFFGDPTKLEPRIASSFYAIDRLMNKQKIEEWLSEGKNVIADRYVSANIGHQGSKISDPKEREKLFEWLHEFEYRELELPRPDLNLLLHMPAEIAFKLKKAQRRYTNKSRDGHEKSFAHLKAAEQSFLHAAKIYDWKIIECSKNSKPLPIEIIHKKLWEIVKEFLEQ